MIITLPDWCLYQSSNGCHDAEHHFLRQLSTEKEKEKKSKMIIFILEKTMHHVRCSMHKQHNKRKQENNVNLAKNTCY